jgi:hypothetical protein
LSNKPNVSGHLDQGTTSHQIQALSDPSTWHHKQDYIFIPDSTDGGGVSGSKTTKFYHQQNQDRKVDDDDDDTEGEDK